MLSCLNILKSNLRGTEGRMTKYKNPDPTAGGSINMDKKDPEVEKNGYSEKKTVYFVFLDVLGFRKAFDVEKQSDDDLKENESIKKFRDVFEHYFAIMDSTSFINKTFDCYAGQTSDSLYFYTNRIEFLFEFLKIFSYFNVYAMTKDVFFRGGIAKGSLYCKEDYQFYGDSVVNAYLLESEISKNPRIIVDENTYNEILNMSDDTELIFSKDVGRAYLKPFAYLENDFLMDLNYDLVEEISKDKLQSIIIKNKKKFEYDSRNYGKFTFLSKEYDRYKDKNKETE